MALKFSILLLFDLKSDPYSYAPQILYKWLGVIFFVLLNRTRYFFSMHDWTDSTPRCLWNSIK